MRDDLQEFITACLAIKQEMTATSNKLHEAFRKLPEAERKLIFDFIGEVQYNIDESKYRLDAAISDLRGLK